MARVLDPVTVEAERDEKPGDSGLGPAAPTDLDRPVFAVGFRPLRTTFQRKRFSNEALVGDRACGPKTYG